MQGAEEGYDLQQQQLPLAPGLRRSLNPYLSLMRRAKSPTSHAHAHAHTTAAAAKQQAILVSEKEPEDLSKPVFLAPTSATPSPPPWLLKDNTEVLRYYAYFKELVYQGGDVTMQGYRIRHFVVYYYTAAGAFAIHEPKELNSGLVQGTFMSKQQVPKTKQQQQQQQQQEFLGPQDFVIGESVNFYGRDLVITDADAYTRGWHARVLGQPLGPPVDPQQVPNDGYKAQRLGVEKPMVLRRQQEEAQAISKPKKLLPFPLRETTVLRFYCAYEDERQGGGGGRRLYTLYYYVSDDTIEIKETREQGRQHFPNLLKRQQVPKESPPHSSSSSSSSSAPPSFYTFQDFVCGASIKVYGRHLLLLSCDANTTSWYAAKGVHQVPLHIASPDSTEPPRKVPIVPPNGFGSDDNDVYALGLKLEPGKYEDKHARLEHSKRGCQVLRFIVHLLRRSSDEVMLQEDLTRDLILNYFESDQTISIYEKPVPNSGIDGGLFLTRGKYKKYIEKQKKDTTINVLGGSHSRFLRPTDFLLSSPPVTLEVAATGARLFTIKCVGYDDYTRKILEEGIAAAAAAGHAGGGEEARSSYICGSPTPTTAAAAAIVVPPTVKITLEKQAEAFVSAELPVREVFRAVDTAGNGLLPATDFVALVRELEVQAKAFPVGRDELVAVMATFLDRGGAAAEHEHDDDDVATNICYDDYVDALCISAPKSVLEQAKEAVGVSQLTIEERLFKALATAFLHGETHRAFLRRTFRQLDVAAAGGRGGSKTGTVDMEHWFKALKLHGLTGLLSKGAASTVLLQFDLSQTGHLHYQALCDAIFNLEAWSSSSSSSQSKQQQQQQQQAVSAAGIVTSSSNNNNNNNNNSSKNKLEAPTVKTHLQNLTHNVLTCDGNLEGQLQNAIQSFSSCFSRLPRKRILRKIFTAFGISSSSSSSKKLISRKQFFIGIQETAAEFFVDFADFDRDVLANFLFPDPETSLVDYEKLLEALCSRDLNKLVRVRQEGMEAVVKLAEETSFEEVDNSRRRDFTGELRVVGFGP